MFVNRILQKNLREYLHYGKKYTNKKNGMLFCQRVSRGVERKVDLNKKYEFSVYKIPKISFIKIELGLKDCTRCLIKKREIMRKKAGESLKCHQHACVNNRKLSYGDKYYGNYLKKRQRADIM